MKPEALDHYPTHRKAIFLRRDICAGLMFVASGLWGLAAAYDLEMGTLSEMGPGFFPRAVSGLLILLGIGIVMTGFSKNAELLELPWTLRPILTIVIASLAFALLLERAGIVLAISANILIGVLAGERPSVPALIVLTISLIVASIALFVWALGMQIPIWPRLTGF